MQSIPVLSEAAGQGAAAAGQGAGVLEELPHGGAAERRRGRGGRRLVQVVQVEAASPGISDITEIAATVYLTSSYLTLSMELTDPKVCSMTSFLV